MKPALLFPRALTVTFFCFLALPALAQNQTWIRQIDSGENEAVLAAAPDGEGGVYTIGGTLGSLGGPSAGGYDAWLARYDGAGSQLWIRQLGTSEWDVGGGASSGGGAVYLCGYTDGSLGGPSAGVVDAWLARYDGAGNQAWIRQLGTSDVDSAAACAPDDGDGAYVCGATHGSLGGPSAGDVDAWLARYDSAGEQLWIRQLGTSDGDYCGAAAPDGTGGVYVSGWTSGSLGGAHAGDGDAWLARYDGAGNQSWIRQLGTSGNDGIRTSAPDGAGGVYVAGSSEGSLGGPNAGGIDPWAARYDGAGNLMWIRQFGTSIPFEETNAAAQEGADGVYLGGGADGPSGGNLYAWLAHFDATGNQFWIRQPEIDSSDATRAAAPDGAGGVYMGGRVTRHRGDAWLGRYEPICGPASVTLRNSGPNPWSFQVSEPVLGSTFTATVDLSTTGHSTAVLFAFDGAVDITLGGGQHVLCADLFGHGTLYRSAQPGPLATFTFPIPIDANLCGFHISMQAVHIGGVVPFALSNAQDLVVGG